MLDRDRLEAIRTGEETSDDLASIVMAHYRTPDLARLCLRAIRRFTDHPYEVIVVDNGSGEASLEVLRSVAWIRLIERAEDEVSDKAPLAHASAMDIGTEVARGRWLVSMHTDTIAHKPGWLGSFVGRVEAAPNAACLGSGKLDEGARWYRAMKNLFDARHVKNALARLMGRQASPRETVWYPRSYCAVYNLPLVRELGLDFQPAPDHRAGERMYLGLVEAGYEAVRLPPNEMREHVEHIKHATSLLGRGGLRHRWTNRKVRRAMKRVMSSDLARELMEDDSLDR